MKYWVYINDKVAGPYEEDNLGALEGLSPDTLLCKDGTQNWVKASSIFDFGTPEPEQPPMQAPAPAVAAPVVSTAAAPAFDASVVQMLVDKIDHLTQEIAVMQTSMKGVENKIAGMENKIDGMESKVEETLQASAATQAAMEQIKTAPVVPPAPVAATAAPAAPVTAPVMPAPAPEQTPVLEEASITNTQNLVNHAEQIVAQATSAETGEKPLDFLNEIHIGDTETDSDAGKAGEEVVLRSALDSMYNPPQTEEEKENTFQDLLSPAQTAAVAGAAAAGAAALTAAAIHTDAPDAAQPPAQDTPVAEIPVADTPVTDTKREEVINEITAAPAPQQDDDIILQAVDQAQDAAPSDVPSLEDAGLPQEATVKKSLDLAADDPSFHLASIGDSNAAQTEPLSQELETASEPAAETAPTAQELVAEKPADTKENTLEEGLVSQQDLDDAFTEREPIASDFPLPEDDAQHNEPKNDAAQPAAQSDGSYNPNDMTEVQLKEGSTYLISDFIPPANTGNTITVSDMAMAATAAATSSTEDKKTEEEPANAKAAGEKQDPAAVTHTLDQFIEEIVPNKAPDDMTMSKVILENTIRTKRGASMDIKTVPMVKEPADSNRLDLTDSDLDLNTQHDMKEADFKQPSSGTTKMILGVLLSIVFVALIYVGLAYLEIIPAQFNFIKKPTEQNTLSTSQMNEMLGEPAQTETVPADDTAALTADGLPAAADMQTPDAAANPMDGILTEVKNVPMVNGQTLEQVIAARHPAAQGLIEWSITTAVEPDNYSVLVKVPPENPQSFRITYRFNYNTVTKALDPTISDSKNLLDSLK